MVISCQIQNLWNHQHYFAHPLPGNQIAQLNLAVWVVIGLLARILQMLTPVGTL